MSVDLFGPTENAVFSECRTFRYSLVRRWADGPTATFVMLNPSTADEKSNDPTVAKCVKFAQSWRYKQAVGLFGDSSKPPEFRPYGRLVVVNIFAWRATDPEELYRVPDPVGPANDSAIIEACLRSELVVCAWGRHGALRDRGLEVFNMLSTLNVGPFCLRQNKDGSPEHPLYVPLATVPIPFERYQV